MSLLRAHKSVFEVVRDALAADSTLSHIKVSVGARFQGEQNPEVIIQQSSFDINDLNTADYGAFEISVFCYANTYTEAAKIADTVFTAIQENDLYTLTEQELIVGSDPEQYNISQTLYHLKGLDLFLEHYDEDGYEANVLVRAIEAEDTNTGVGDYIPKTSGSPAPFYAQLDSRIQDLSDVNVNSLGEGQILKYDVSEGEWVNADLPLLASNGLVSSTVNGYTLLSLADSQSFTSASTSGDLSVGGNLTFVGSQTKLIRPLNTGQAVGPLTIQSNGDLIVELDENADELDKSFIVKNGADTEVFKVNEAGNVTVNQEYVLPTTDGNANYFLKTDGSGQLYFATLYGTSGNTGGAPPPAIDTITELLDTQVSSLADNQILRYDSASSKWINEDLTLAQSIGDLTDVDTTTVAPADGQALVWNNTNSEWEPGDVGIDGVSSTAADPDVLANWTVDSSQIIGVGSFNTSGNEIAFGEGHPRDLYFKPDGSKLFLVGNGLDDIASVDVPTAWDLSSIPSSATVTTVNITGTSSIGGGGFEGSLFGLYVASDSNDTDTYGKKFFVTGNTRDEVQEYTCTTAWDLSTMSVNATSFLSVNSVTNSPYGVEFKPDGSVMYISNTGTGVFHFDLSTNWDLSTAVHDSNKSVTLALTAADGQSEDQIRNLTFSSDGTKVYIVGDRRECLWQLNLSTAWDVSSYSQDQVLTLSSGYVEQQFDMMAGQNFNTSSGLHSTDDYLFILFNGNDQIIRMDKTGNINLDIDGQVRTRATFHEGLTSYGSINTSGAIRCPAGGSRFGGNTYFGGQVNVGTINGSGLYQNSSQFHVGAPYIRFSGNGQANQGGNEYGLYLRPTDGYRDALYTVYFPNRDGNVLLDTTPNLYYNKFDSDAESKVTGATEVVEYYYTARADGQGQKELFRHDVAASGQTISRKVYYATKALADPDTAVDWTLDTSHSAYTDSVTAAKALLNSASSGTPPLSLKVATTGLTTISFLQFDSGDFTLAYSLRLVNPSYTGAAIRVINDSSVEADIGFVEEELDTTALLNHCGSGDGYITIWYDQAQGGATGSGNDASYGNPHLTPVNRPKIVSAGSVLTDGGKPCLFVEDSSLELESQVDFTPNGTMIAYVASKDASADSNSGMILGDYQGTSNQQSRIWEKTTQIEGRAHGGSRDYTFASPEDGTVIGAGQKLVAFYRDSSNYWYMDRNSVTSGSSINRNYNFCVQTLFSGHNNTAYCYHGNVQEIVMFNTDKSSERAAIKSNINTYYSIY